MRPRRSFQKAPGWQRALAAIALVAALFITARAEAQSTTFYLDRLQVAGAPNDGLGMWRPEIGESRVFGQAAIGYAHNPLRVQNIVDNTDKIKALKGPPVTDQLTTYFTVGAEILERASVSATFPLIVFQRGYATDSAALGIHDAVTVEATAPSDLRVDSRVMVMKTSQGRFKLGARAALFLPTGDERSFAGDAGAWTNIGLSTELNFKTFFITLNAGASIRPQTRLNDLTVGSELTYGLAVYAPLLSNRLRLGAELFGSAGLLPQTRGELDASPLEASLSTRLFVDPKLPLWVGLGAGARLTGGYAPDTRLVALLGGAFAFKKAPVEPGPSPRARENVDSDEDGAPDVIDECPVEREDQINPEDGCPEPPDSDNDGVQDPFDKCPSEPEDRDSVNDGDGCPESDADSDGVVDAVDKCPKEPGIHDEDPEKNGCPQFIRRVKREVKLVKQIDFESDKATILERSYPILDEIVELLRVNPEIKLLSVEGHTDNRGSVEHNEHLSQLRASAVCDYLIEHGVAPRRLIFMGFGPRNPITANDTPEGRAKNRRVEFYIVKQSADGP